MSSSIDQLQEKVDQLVPDHVFTSFASLPISQNSKQGLKGASFVDMTDIQAKTIPLSLKGHDLLAAAKTGSGKTLAFLVPVLEILFRQKWGPSDGLGALLISPTRELAVQTFQVLRSIGRSHSFSAGLVIGGKNLKVEQDRLSRMNILVATPGRLLQHLDQTVGFQCENLQLLVLDEADRILDMGFSKTLSALLGHLPKTRQTLLFSATQTQSVNDLARLSLKNPVSIGIGQDSTSIAVPEFLEHFYSVCPLPKKLDVLWGFLRTHLKSKILIFFTSCKQVRFVYETFCKLQPGIPILHLHGKQKQTARMDVYDRFTSMSCAVLFATDIASRGLDFPSVEWVVQVDTPEDPETYIHRVGRTARFDQAGKALLLLLPSEQEGMLACMQTKGIKINEIKIKSSKIQSIQNRLQKILFEDPEIKYLGQRAFISYVRSIYIHKNKDIFHVDQLPLAPFAESLGLPGVPNVKFLKHKQNAPRNHGKNIESKPQEEDHPTAPPPNPEVRTKYDRMFERKNQNILSDHYSKIIDHDSDNGDSEDDLLTLTRADHDLNADGTTATLDTSDLSNRQQRMGKAKRALKDGPRGKKLVFDDEGNPHEIYELAEHAQWVQQHGGRSAITQQGLNFATGERSKMNETDNLDKMEAKEKKIEKKRKRKQREKEEQPELPTAPSLPSSDDDASPESDLVVPSKRPRLTTQASTKPTSAIAEEDEQLALLYLRR